MQQRKSPGELRSARGYTILAMKRSKTYGESSIESDF